MDSDSDVVMLLAAFRCLAAAKDGKCRALCAAALPKVLRGVTPRRSACLACTHLGDANNKWRLPLFMKGILQIAHITIAV